MYNICISSWITFVLKRATISCFSFEYINAYVMFHAVKNDPIPFSVMSLANCCSFYLRVRARSAITTISHINLSIKTAIVCSYCQWNWQHMSKKNKTKTKQNTICVGHHYTQTNTNNVNEYMQNQCLTHMLQEG